MKKLFYPLFVFAAMAMTTSCSQDEELVQQSGEMTTFKVELDGAAKSRTAGDGQTVNELYYAVYDKNGDNVIYPADAKYGKTTVTAGKATVSLPLMKSEAYDIVFWAQNKDANAYTFTELTEITVNYTGLKSNQENRDAFFNTLNDYIAKGNTQTVELRRPFAQLNVATSIEDWKNATYLYQANGNDGYPVKSSSVTIDNLATTFNAKTGAATGETSAEVVFDKNDILDESIWIKSIDNNGNEVKSEYKLLAMNYVLMESDKLPQDTKDHEKAEGDNSRATVEVDFTLWKDDANAIVSANVPFAPIQRNYRTNIIGHFLTGDATQFNIVVDANFDNDDNNVESGIIFEDDKKLARIYSVDGLKYFRDLVNGEKSRAATSFRGWTVYLEKNIDLNNEEWTPIGLGNAFDGTFDGKGNTVSNFTINLPGQKAVGFIGSLHGTVKNVKIQGAKVKGMKSVGALVGSAIASTIADCTVESSEVETAMSAEGKEGNNAGGLIGYISDENQSTISGNTVSGVKVTAYADLGALAGTINAYKSNLEVIGNKVIDSEVIVADRTNYKEDRDVNANLIVGRAIKATMEDNVAENTYVVAEVNTEDRLKEALTLNSKSIKVRLAGDLSYDIAAKDNYAMGGENTETIIIEGNAPEGRSAAVTTLTFKQTDSDWNNVVTKGAKLILKNLNITSTKNGGNGAWNNYILMFACEVEMDNVEANWAIGLGKESVLNNVKIEETGDYYAIYVKALGEKVVIDGLEVKSVRGIKVIDEYISNPEKVQLNISNSTFTTQKKAAVLITSTAGADIIWGENNDISGVDADGFNAVWVDEDRKDNADLVTVTGEASKVVEGTTTVVDTEDGADALKNAAETDNAYIQLMKGEYTFPAVTGTGVTIECAEGVVFEGTSKLNINGATVIGGTFSNPAGNAVSSTINGTFKDCTFTGNNALRNCYAGETVVFENCVFDGSVYGVHFDGGANEAIFKNCTFSGFNAFGSALTMLTLDGCTFKANGKSGYNGANLWGSTTAINCKFEFDGKASTEWIDAIGEDKEYTFTGCTTVNGNNILTAAASEKFFSRNEGTTVTVDGVKYEKFKSHVFIADKEGLFAFANDVNVNENTYNGKTVNLIADIDLKNEVWTPVGQTGKKTFNGVFDGQNHTISNLNVDSSKETGANYSSGLFGWVESHTAGHGHIKNVKIEGAIIKGNHNCGALVGYITNKNALVENCHVVNAVISCTVANKDANGDKAGALIGNATAETPIKNCTAKNSSVSAGRDAGQVIGAGKEANVTGCSASEVTVSANGQGTGDNIRNEVIGRLL